MNRAQFMRKYRSLTPTKRSHTAIAVDVKGEEGKLFASPYTWNDLYREILRKSETSKRLLEAMK